LLKAITTVQMIRDQNKKRQDKKDGVFLHGGMQGGFSQLPALTSACLYTSPSLPWALKCLQWPTLLVVIHPHTELEILVYVLPAINKRFCFQMTATQHKKAETELEEVGGGGEGL
jgi:hypothetical protein